MLTDESETGTNYQDERDENNFYDENSKSNQIRQNLKEEEINKNASNNQDNNNFGGLYPPIQNNATMLGSNPASPNPLISPNNLQDRNSEKAASVQKPGMGGGMSGGIGGGMGGINGMGGIGGMGGVTGMNAPGQAMGINGYMNQTNPGIAGSTHTLRSSMKGGRTAHQNLMGTPRNLNSSNSPHVTPTQNSSNTQASQPLNQNTNQSLGTIHSGDKTKNNQNTLLQKNLVPKNPKTLSEHNTSNMNDETSTSNIDEYHTKIPSSLNNQKLSTAKERLKHKYKNSNLQQNNYTTSSSDDGGNDRRANLNLVRNFDGTGSASSKSGKAYSSKDTMPRKDKGSLQLRA